MRQGYIIAGRIVAPFFFVGLTIYSFITKRQRARVLVTDGKYRVLLVRGIVSSGDWTLPGGGLKKGELAIDAAQRELHEEIGVKLPKKSFVYLWTLERPEIKIPYVALLYRARVKKTEVRGIKIDKREIREARWFTRSNLPMNLSKEASAALSQTFDN